ncbi:hypothetical protein LPB140_01755 [Sphingorhabdus lutea]|uniref:Molecular chaperone n=2 Tax=Sphingorhabdus lutea TaxID=1913578 RepID=A0A1L3JEE7_9SPHN|nr:hypothetical protein LPB140_01755 [Sphingorhabdus lutea]
MISTIRKNLSACIAAIGLAAVSLIPLQPAMASGDLLVAPTRVILDSQRGTEVILNNIGTEETTYRISLELRRMNDLGRLDEVAEEDATEKESTALSLIRYAPRRVTLPPNQPQAIRVGLNNLKDLADGEYRAHMMFRAIPNTASVAETQDAGGGLQIQLIPIYGITIPIIIRKGNISASAAIANPRLAQDETGANLFLMDLSREGDRSVFGEIYVTKAGQSEPLMVAKGIAIYPELDKRTIVVPITAEQAATLNGNVTISYYEAPEAGGGLISEIKTTM